MAFGKWGFKGYKQLTRPWRKIDGPFRSGCTESPSEMTEAMFSGGELGPSVREGQASGSCKSLGGREWVVGKRQ
jgi:hypothetical protein